MDQRGVGRGFVVRSAFGKCELILRLINADESWETGQSARTEKINLVRV
jgi:hypothetical protein